MATILPPLSAKINSSMILVNKNSRRILFLALIVIIIVENITLYFAKIESVSKEIIYTNWIIIVNSSISVGLAIVLVSRQKFEGLHGKTHAAIAIGLVLWLCANITWAIYEVGLEQVAPVPSLADAFQLSAYAFFAYHLYMTYKEFHKKFLSRNILIISIIASVIFLCFIIPFTINLSVLSTERGIAMFSVIIAYPILNTILIVPAVILLIGFRNEQQWSIPWICESLALLILAVADSWFAFIFLTRLIEELWLSHLFLIDHYLIIAAGLLWYIKFLTPSDNKHAINLIRRIRFLYRPKKRIQFMAITIATIITAGMVVNLIYPFFFFHSNTSIDVEGLSNGTIQITIGALLGLSGISSDRGESQKAALEIAIQDVNDNLSNSNIRMDLIVEDTKRNPAIALEKLKSLAEKNVRIVIGPQTSSELEAVKDYANKNNILLISHSSTAPSLAFKDNIFRFVTYDRHQSEAIIRQMRIDGVEVIVPIWRSDVWGNDLYKIIKDNFTNLGGKEVYNGIGYKAPIGKFAASLNRINFIIWDQDLKNLSSQVSKAISEYGTKKVGVYIIAMDEIVPVLIQAQNHPVLGTVKWYGTDGSAQNERLIRNIEAARFAVNTDFVSTLLGLDEENKKLNDLEDQLKKKIGKDPSSYDANAYDALWVAALTENVTRGTDNIQDLKGNLSQIANSFLGVTGKLSLNKNGDREYGTYDYWMVTEEDNSTYYHWKKVSKYKPDSYSIM